MSAQQKQVYMKGFNTCIAEFIDLVDREFPNDHDITYAKNAILTVKKTNPRILVEYWLQYIFVPNKDKISALDITVLTEGHHEVLDGIKGGEKIREAIQRFRGPISKMDTDKQYEVATLIFKISKLSCLYFS